MKPPISKPPSAERWASIAHWRDCSGDSGARAP